VADKRKLHHRLTVLKRVKTWQLIILLVVFGVGAAIMLRQNNLHMIELRNVVTKADENPEGDTKTALINLQHYVSQHMNTSLGNGIYLQETYQRAYAAAVQQAVNTTNPQAKLYEQVEIECRPVYERTKSFPAYTLCAKEKLDTLAPNQDALANVKTPSADLYHYNFASPLISFDGAGILVILTGVTALVIAIRLVAYIVLKVLLHTRRPKI
jgi:hypothetical protein